MAVYFIQAGGRDGYIKIGTAKSVTRRLANLQSASPVTLKLLHCIDGGKDTEREIHFRFAHRRLRGEWFIPGEDLLDFCGVVRKTNKPKNPRPPAGEIMPRWLVDDIVQGGLALLPLPLPTP